MRSLLSQRGPSSAVGLIANVDSITLLLMARFLVSSLDLSYVRCMISGVSSGYVYDNVPPETLYPAVRVYSRGRLRLTINDACRPWQTCSPDAIRDLATEWFALRANPRFLPSRWSKYGVNAERFTIFADGRRALYAGSGFSQGYGESRAGLRTDFWVPRSDDIFYFEVAIEALDEYVTRDVMWPLEVD